MKNLLQLLSAAGAVGTGALGAREAYRGIDHAIDSAAEGDGHQAARDSLWAGLGGSLALPAASMLSRVLGRRLGIDRLKSNLVTESGIARAYRDANRDGWDTARAVGYSAIPSALYLSTIGKPGYADTSLVQDVAADALKEDLTPVQKLRDWWKDEEHASKTGSERNPYLSAVDKHVADLGIEPMYMDEDGGNASWIDAIGYDSVMQLDTLMRAEGWGGDKEAAIDYTKALKDLWMRRDPDGIEKDNPYLNKAAEVYLDLEIGDVVLTGRYKNKRTVVKSLGTDDMGMPTMNGQKLLALRIEKLLPRKNWSRKSIAEEKTKKAHAMKLEHLHQRQDLDANQSFEQFSAQLGAQAGEQMDTLLGMDITNPMQDPIGIAMLGGCHCEHAERKLIPYEEAEEIIKEREMGADEPICELHKAAAPWGRILSTGMAGMGAYYSGADGLEAINRFKDGDFKGGLSYAAMAGLGALQPLNSIHKARSATKLMRGGKSLADAQKTLTTGGRMDSTIASSGFGRKMINKMEGSALGRKFLDGADRFGGSRFGNLTGNPAKGQFLQSTAANMAPFMALSHLAGEPGDGQPTAHQQYNPYAMTNSGGLDYRMIEAFRRANNIGGY